MIPLLQSIDIFGTDFKLNIKGKESITTLLGGLVTLILGLTTLVLTWYFGQDIYLKESPYYLSKTAYKNSTPIMDVNTSNFFFAYHIEDASGIPFYNESFFHYNFYYEYYKMDIATGKLKVLDTVEAEPVKCNTEHIDNKTLYEKFTTFYCMNINEYKFGGDWRESNIAILYYYIDKCLPEWAEPRNVTCANQAEFEDLGSLYLGYYTFQNLLDPENFTNPINKIYSYNFQGLDRGNVYPHYKFSYSFSNLTTDQGIFFEDIQNEEFLTFDDLQIDTMHYPNYGSFLEISFYLSNKNQVHVRSYIKIPDIVAQVGGILSLFFPFIEIILRIFTDNQYTLYLFNNLFKMQLKDNSNTEVNENIIELKSKSESIRKDEIANLNEINYKSKRDNILYLNNEGKDCTSVMEDKLDLNKSAKSPENMSVNKGSNKDLYQKINDSNNNNSNKFTKKESILIKDLEKVITIKSKQNDNVEITDCKRLYYTYCCGKDKIDKDRIFKLLFVAEEELAKKCDFIEIAKYLDQFRLLKKLVLNEGQCTLLKSRELKALTDETLIEEELQEEKTNKQILAYLKDQQDTGTLNHIDKVLTYYLRSDTKDIIKSEINI